jgi:hypothetical protein
MDGVLKVRVVCTKLPGIRFVEASAGVVREPVHLGVQRGTEVIDLVPADRRQVTFNVEFEVGRQPDGRLNFLGPYAQGDRHDRFFYLSWAEARGDTFAMFRRLKIRLGHLTERRVLAAVRNGRPITVRLSLTDTKGGPLCATPPAANITWE